MALLLLKALHVLKAEFQIHRLFYSYHDTRVFYCAQWKFPHPCLFLAIRLILSLYSAGALVHYLVTGHSSVMIFLTTWSYIMLTVHLALAAVLSCVFYKKVHHRRVSQINGHSTEINGDAHCIEIPQRVSEISPTLTTESDQKGKHSSVDAKAHNDLPTGNGNCPPANQAPLSEAAQWYFKLSWILSDINFCAAPVVTSIYFSTIFPKKYSGLDYVDLNVHILNTAFVIIDFIVCARPLRLLHAWVPMLYGVCWLFFSIIYWSVDKQNHIIYDIIDWNKPGITVAWVFGLLALTALFKFIYFGLYRLKIWLYTVIHKEDYFIDIDRD